MTKRPYNFGAGPAMLPTSILKEAQAELLNWQDLGMSIMEVGHRTPKATELMQQLENLFREILNIPVDYSVIFLSGAARTQFAMIPMNFLCTGEQAGYFVTGTWSMLAFEEACKIKQAFCIASTQDSGFESIPENKTWRIPDNTAYVYFTPNETIQGVRYHPKPNVGKTTLIADMTSCLLSEPINVHDYGLIFAGAQKNISIAGLTVVIIQNELLDKALDMPLPTMFDYRTHVNFRSLYATPPLFNCYLALKMLQWIKAQGGIDTLYKLNCQKATTLYQYIDASTFYHCKIKDNARSIQNVCFSLVQKDLESVFVKKASEQGLYALQGHRSVGGIRASLYNAMPLAGVETLIAFMQDFAKEYS